MTLPNHIVKDSSIYGNPSDNDVINSRGYAIRTGIVKEIRDMKHDDIRYVVEVFKEGNRIPLLCCVVSRFGGIYNYEEFTLRGFVQGQDKAGVSAYGVRPGDVVLVANINGSSSEGVILGGINHPGRKRTIKANSGIVYASELNGIETTINKIGEYRRTFKGLQTNIAALDKASNGSKIPYPEYNTEIGSTYYELDKTGSWHVNDNAKQKPQFIKIDKPNGIITLMSGAVVIKMEKGPEKITVTCKLLDVTAADKINMTTKDYSLKASATAKIKSPKIAIGTDGIELLDRLIKLIDAIGTLQAISPVGLCTPLQVSGTWPQVMKERAAIETIKGTL